ncbi:MAG: ABC transporter permease [candidate division WOR-3 bacterium]|nr:MAG: ABC transporter permease [candidate division WOR-3 bacterium]
MNLFRLAFRNFFRNTRRSIISGISVTIAIAAIIFAQSYIRGITINISDNIVRLISGHIRITTQEYDRRERMLPLDESIVLSGDFLENLDDDRIKVVAPRIKFGVLLGDEELSTPALGYAIEPDKEKFVSRLDTRITKGKYITAGRNEVLLGTALAERIDVHIGDTLTIITRTAYDSPTGINLVVTGLFFTGIGGIDRSIFYIPLDVGQQMLDLEDQATEISLVLDDPDEAVAVAQDLRSRLGLIIMPFQFNPLLTYIQSAGIVFSLFYFIILLVACSTIANTMLMVVFERTKEIGMMKAMGLNNISVVVLLVIEAGMIGAVGSLMGAGIGAALSYWLKYTGIDLTIVSSTMSSDMPFGPILYFSPTPFIIISSFIFGLIAAVVIALLPVSKVTRLQPAKALKTV